MQEIIEEENVWFQSTLFIYEERNEQGYVATTTPIAVSIHSLHLRREKYEKSNYYNTAKTVFQSTLFIYEERNPLKDFGLRAI